MLISSIRVPYTPTLAAPAPAPAPAAPPAPAPKQTPYQRLKNSPPVKFARENKTLTAVAGVGTSIVVAGGAAQSKAFANVAQYGLAPAFGGSMALVGAAAVHDALVNDLKDHKARAAVKIALGTTAALGGTEIVGRSWSIPVLDHALTTPLEKIGDNGMAIMGAGVIAGGAAAGKFALNRFNAAAHQKGHRPANALLGVTSSGAAVAGVLGGTELIGRQYHIAGLDHVFTKTVEMLSHGGLGSVAGGGFLVAGGGVLAAEAVQNFRNNGNDLLTVVEGMGAASTTLGGLELAGHGLGIKSLQGLLTNHMDAVGSGFLATSGAALTRMAYRDVKANGVGIKNSLMGTAGSTMAVGGTGLAAYTLGLHGVERIAEHATEIAGGLGLALTTYACGRGAYNSFKKGDVVAGAGYTLGGTFAAGGSLASLGSGVGSYAIEHFANRALDQVVNHVLEPSARFLYNHPVAGAVMLAAGVGSYAYYRYRASHPRPAAPPPAAPPPAPAKP